MAMQPSFCMGMDDLKHLHAVTDLIGLNQYFFLLVVVHVQGEIVVAVMDLDLHRLPQARNTSPRTNLPPPGC
jgi:hypothetical protein